MDYKQMTEQPYPDNTLSEETRRMLDPTQNAMAKHQMAVFDLIDEICRPAHIPYKPKHAALIARLKNLAVDLDLSGNTTDWQTVNEAIEALGG
jgi:hypothetical protein